MDLNSLGRAICVSLKTSHLSQAGKKLTASDVQSLDVVRWLFSEIVRQPVDGVSDDHDPENNPRFTAEELTTVTNTELEGFADKLIQKNKYPLLKTHKGSDIEKSVAESACDFLVRAFRHYAVEEKAATRRMMASVSNSIFAGTRMDVMQRNIGIPAQLLDTIKVVNQSTLARDLERASIDPTWPIILDILAAQKHAAGMYAGSKHWTEYSDWNRIDRFSTVGEVLRAQAATLHHLAMCSSAAVDEARRIAELAQTCTLQASLDPFRTSVEPFASKLLHLQTLDMVKSPAYLDAFMQTSTISDIFANSIRVDHQLQEAMRQFTQAPVPTFDTMNGHRQFLDAAGFRLSHWPHVRLLTIGEKRRRLRVMISNNAEPVHVKKAKSLTHRYELTLRAILDDAMTSAYGENWAVERLPLCDCKGLLGKWQKRGGEVLSLADYAHYERIMSYPEHFEAVFGAGFDDRAALAALINKAGSLRSKFAHSNPFTPEDLRDLRLIWLTIETGLLALTDDYDFEN